MKLLRVGQPGQERPACLDKAGRLRDISGHVADLAGVALSDACLDTLRALDPATLPEISGAPRIGPCVGGVGKYLAIGLN